jgi:AbrB family looped-hinge helix DNA binding protein
MNVTTVQIRRKGVITIPAQVRRKYSLDEGDVFTLIDLGEGTFLLSPKVSQVAREGDKVAQMLAEQDVTLDDILETLDQERAAYYNEHYVKS